MRARRHGCIVNVTSVAGRVGMAPQAAYAASKWAFEAWAVTLPKSAEARRGERKIAVKAGGSAPKSKASR
jgi:NAD(P)-dependent dehydrogenase (short-subunit alcohol dehydrogenase family)